MRRAIRVVVLAALVACSSEDSGGGVERSQEELRDTEAMCLDWHGRMLDYCQNCLKRTASDCEANILDCNPIPRANYSLGYDSYRTDCVPRWTHVRTTCAAYDANDTCLKAVK